jgi:hypothetical protein
MIGMFLSSASILSASVTMHCHLSGEVPVKALIVGVIVGVRVGGFDFGVVHNFIPCFIPFHYWLLL